LGHYDWSLGCPKSADVCELPPDALPPGRRQCRPAPLSSAALASPDAVSVDPPASSELVPLPTRPVFGTRMDGRQAGIIAPPLPQQPAEPPAEQIATPPAAALGQGASLKLRRADLAPSAD